jgi:uncharacterized protein YjgD (DUF1641 family)
MPGGPAATSPTAAGLERLAAQLDRIEARLARLDPLVAAAEQAPALAAMAGDIVDDAAARLDLHARVERAARLVERLTRPDVLDQVERLVDAAEAAPGLVATALDTLDRAAADAQASGVDLAQVVPQFTEMALDGLRALQAAKSAPPKRPGLWSVFQAVRDPHVSRAFGFWLEVARSFGGDLSQADTKNRQRSLPPARIP